MPKSPAFNPRSSLKYRASVAVTPRSIAARKYAKAKLKNNCIATDRVTIGGRALPVP